MQKCVRNHYNTDEARYRAPWPIKTQKSRFLTNGQHLCRSSFSVSILYTYFQSILVRVFLHSTVYTWVFSQYALCIYEMCGVCKSNICCGPRKQPFLSYVLLYVTSYTSEPCISETLSACTELIHILVLCYTECIDHSINRCALHTHRPEICARNYNDIQRWSLGNYFNTYCWYVYWFVVIHCWLTLSVMYAK